MNRFQRSFRLLSQSLAIIRRDRSLLWFPVLSAAFTLIAVAIVLVPAAVLLLPGATADSAHTWPMLVVAGMAGYAATAVATYFNVALVSCAARSFHGEDTSAGEGMRAANARLGSILLWALIASLVGLVIRAVEQRTGLVGSIVARLLGAGWAIATYFVIPVLAFEQLFILPYKQTPWGESLIGNVGLGIATFLLALPLLGVGLLGAAVVGASPAAGVGLLVVAAGLGVVLLVVSSAMGQIYKTAVYLYAETGEIAGYSSELLEGAFRDKRPRRRFFG